MPGELPPSIELYSALTGKGKIPQRYKSTAIMRYMRWDYWQYRYCPISELRKIMEWMDAEGMARRGKG